MGYIFGGVLVVSFLVVSVFVVVSLGALVAATESFSFPSDQKVSQLELHRWSIQHLAKGGVLPTTIRGSRRHETMQEYFHRLYEKVQQYEARGKKCNPAYLSIPEEIDAYLQLEVCRNARTLKDGKKLKVSYN